MIPLFDLIHYFLDNGGNVDRLCLATNIDRQTFMDILECGSFDAIESRIIRKEIKLWEGEN